jgi:hypothetical protein
MDRTVVQHSKVDFEAGHSDLDGRLGSIICASLRFIHALVGRIIEMRYF